MQQQQNRSALEISLKKFNVIILFVAIFAISSASEDYESYIRSVKGTRDSLHTEYIKSADSIKREIVFFSKYYLLNQIVDKSFIFWSGTKWDFYGNTRIPRTGNISCGYFVTTVLYDIGLNIPRVSWAESASEVFITKLSRNIKRFRNKPIADVLSYVNSKPEGLYMVGLDCHVGFIYSFHNRVRFVHANYYRPEIGVMEQELNSKNPLMDSKYRILGRILDNEMVVNWLTYNKYQ